LLNHLETAAVAVVRVAVVEAVAAEVVADHGR